MIYCDKFRIKHYFILVLINIIIIVIIIMIITIIILYECIVQIFIFPFLHMAQMKF